MFTVGAKVLSDVTLGNLSFNVQDENGVFWSIEDIDGWWYPPDIEMPDEQKPESVDGGYDAEGRYLSRLITLRGHFTPRPSVGPSAIQAARERLIVAANAVRTTTLLTVNESPPKQAYVRMVGRPRIATTQLNGKTEFEISLRAADPRKYATSLTISDTGVATPGDGRTYDLLFNRVYGASGSEGVLSAVNLGIWFTPAKITFTGPVDQPGVEHVELNRTLKFDISLAEGDTLEVDLDTHDVILNGSANRRNTMTIDSLWFLLLPGVNSLRFLGTPTEVSSSTGMSVSFRSAWV